MCQTEPRTAWLRLLGGSQRGEEGEKYFFQILFSVVGPDCFTRREESATET